MPSQRLTARWAQSSIPGLKTNTPGALEGVCGIGPPASYATHSGCSPLVPPGAAEPRAQGGGGPSAGLPSP